MIVESWTMEQLDSRTVEGVNGWGGKAVERLRGWNCYLFHRLTWLPLLQLNSFISLIV